MIKAVILDLDDTLCLTEQACFDIENAALQDMGRAAMGREVHLATWGKPLFEAITERSPGVNVEEFRKHHSVRIKEAIENKKLDSIPEENFQAIDQLIELGKSIIVLTSREHGELEHLLEPSHGLADRIEAFYYKDNMQYHKPDPRAFEHIEHEHGWKPDECVYVGDSISDAIAAKGAGLHFIASLESGLRTEEDFAGQPVDIFIKSFPEVIDAVRQLKESYP